MRITAGVESIKIFSIVKILLLLIYVMAFMFSCSDNSPTQAPATKPEGTFTISWISQPRGTLFGNTNYYSVYFKWAITSTNEVGGIITKITYQLLYGGSPPQVGGGVAWFEIENIQFAVAAYNSRSIAETTSWNCCVQSARIGISAIVKDNYGYSHTLQLIAFISWQ